MTAGAGARRWANDYGDIPRWYWLPRFVLTRRARLSAWPRRRGWVPWALMLAVLA